MVSAASILSQKRTPSLNGRNVFRAAGGIAFICGGVAPIPRSPVVPIPIKGGSSIADGITALSRSGLTAEVRHGMNGLLGVAGYESRITACTRAVTRHAFILGLMDVFRGGTFPFPLHDRSCARKEEIYGMPMQKVRNSSRQTIIRRPISPVPCISSYGSGTPRGLQDIV